ncbi:MAG: hypothetical protein WAZ60_15865 [Desulfosalsimonadaceae bacterium]
MIKLFKGAAFRSKEPIRFWSKIAIWSLFYVFAVVLPIVFAIKKQNKQIKERDSATSRSQLIRSEINQTSSVADFRR